MFEIIDAWASISEFFKILVSAAKLLNLVPYVYLKSFHHKQGEDNAKLILGFTTMV